MHDFVRHLSVSGLFGYVSHEVDFRVEDQITILTGVNGSGKTHVLTLLRSLVSLDFNRISRIPCSSARIDFESGKSLQVDIDDSNILMVHGDDELGRTRTVAVELLPDPVEEAVPAYYERIDEDLWLDPTDGEVITADILRRRHGLRISRSQGPMWRILEQSDDDYEWLQRFRSKSIPTLVETRRLDSQFHRRTGISANTAPLGRSRIRQYVNEVSEQIASARRQSFEVSQRADRQFASRALDRARATVQESKLKKDFQQLAELNQELHRNGLTEESMGVELPSGPRMNPTERRILAVFLQDWRAKLAALEEVHQKVELLREIVGTKIGGKSIVVESGQLTFRNDMTHEQIHVDRLSSGEQHLLALFAMLIFSAQPGTLVLIDEPEISLHAAWKHAFLDDIRRVAELNDLQMVLATHSSGIVHGEWELAEELVLPSAQFRETNG